MLTSKQEKYVQNLIKGMSQREAYKDAYPTSKKWKETAIDSQASILFKNSKVLDRYNELQGKAEKETIMTAVERKEWLTKVINGEIKDTVYYNVNGATAPIERTADLNTKIKALDTLNKMSGEYVTKIEGDIGITTIEVDLNDE